MCLFLLDCFFRKKISNLQSNIEFLTSRVNNNQYVYDSNQILTQDNYQTNQSSNNNNSNNNNGRYVDIGYGGKISLK